MTLDAIRAAAEAATPDLTTVPHNWPDRAVPVLDRGLHKTYAYMTGGGDHEQALKDATFIATASPSVVLDLVTAAEAVPEDPWHEGYAASPGLVLCGWCLAEQPSHEPSCRWTVARAAIARLEERMSDLTPEEVLLNRSLNALRLEVPTSVADDVERNVRKAMAAAAQRAREQEAERIIDIEARWLHDDAGHPDGAFGDKRCDCRSVVRLRIRPGAGLPRRAALTDATAPGGE